MIENFRSKPLKLFFEMNDSSKIKPDHAEKARMIISRLNRAMAVKDMNAPGLGLHSLKGDMKGHWAVSVKSNWRITFRFIEANVYDVDYIESVYKVGIFRSA